MAWTAPHPALPVASAARNRGCETTKPKNTPSGPLRKNVAAVTTTQIGILYFESETIKFLHYFTYISEVCVLMPDHCQAACTLESSMFGGTGL